MTDFEPTEELIADLRRRGAERTDVALKAGTRKLPASLRETISAFANGEGGIILVGLDDDVQPVPIDAEAIRDALAGMAADDLVPAIRGRIEIETVDGGHRIVRMDVPELPLTEKPCYVEAKGRYAGSYIRTGDGDRRLTQYEVDRLLENRAQPQFDMEPVVAAQTSDLDPSLFEPYLARMRAERPRAFAGLSDSEMLRNLGITCRDGASEHPTIAGLLTFGRDPQQFFPQLFVSFIALPTPVLGELGPGGERFLDNQDCQGPMGDMVSAAVAAVVRNLRRTSVMDGAERKERLDYPLEAIRELIVNAVMHRDYSPLARGTQVQVELYPDRLVVKSPGGFYGNVSPEDFGAPDVSSSRNQRLARLLADVPLGNSGGWIAENRGSGIPTILRSLARAGMAPPEFDATLSRVSVTLPHHALLNADTLDWIASLGQPDLSQEQVQALAVVRQGGRIRNQTLQGWGFHAADATRALGDLVQRGLLEKIGDRRGASYQLAELTLDPGRPGPAPNAPVSDVASQRRHAVKALLSRVDTASMLDIAEELGISRALAQGVVKELIESGLVAPTARPRSRNRRYYLVSGATRPGPLD